MAPVDNMQSYSTDNGIDGGFEGFTLRSLSLSEPSLPAAATPCNSRMGTPAPAGANAMRCGNQLTNHAFIQQADERLRIAHALFAASHACQCWKATHSDDVHLLIACANAWF